MDFYLRTIKQPNNELHEGKAPIFWSQGENDLIVDTNGDFALTSGEDLLLQSMAKILVTERGANTLFTIYGARLQSFVGTRMNVDYLRSEIKTDIIDSLRIYQFINKDSGNLDEQIETLQSLKINLIGTDAFDVSFSVITRDGSIVGGLVQIEG